MAVPMLCHREVCVYMVSLALSGVDHWDGSSNSRVSSPTLDSLEEAHGETEEVAGVVGMSCALWHDGIGLSSPEHLW